VIGVTTWAPSSLEVAGLVALAAATTLAAGLWIQAARPSRVLRAAAWALTLAVVAGGHFALAEEGPGLRMIVLILLLCYGMKAVVALESRIAGMRRMTLAEWCAFGVFWFGMQPREFVSRARGRVGDNAKLLLHGLGFVVAGAATFLVAQRILAEGHERTAGIVLVAAFSMVMHFGVIPCLAVAFQSRGFNVAPQFRAPWRSQNLHEFWARRWNIGFSVMTVIAIYRPFGTALGRNGALLLGFLASGLFHEVACSVPVGAGYGLPTLYFALHGIAMLVERGLERRGFKIRGIVGRVWVFAWVLLPVTLVFHMPFLRGIALTLL
jgi:hypothetical protein